MPSAMHRSSCVLTNQHPDVQAEYIGARRQRQAPERAPHPPMLTLDLDMFSRANGEKKELVCRPQNSVPTGLRAKLHQ